MIRYRIKIMGNPVQGVFFRDYLRQKAQELLVSGWVANEGDGSVTAVVEGPKNQVVAFEEACHSGPSRANVEKVEITEEPYTGEFEGFEIRY